MRKLVTLLFFSFCFLSTFAQSYRLYTSDNELSSSLINDIFQDHRGIIWIATEDGLTRYDGVKFLTYKHIDGDDTSLAHNLVRCIAEDKAGHLYIGTHLGLQCFNREENNFTKVAEDEKGKLLVGNVNKILQLSNGEVWASGNDLFQVVFKEGKLQAKGVNYAGPHNYIQDFVEDINGNIWVAHMHDGIYKSNKKTGEIKHYTNDKSNVNYMNIAADEKGNVFVGTHGLGVLRLNRNTDTFETIPGTEDILVGTLSVPMEGNTNMLIGTDGLGIIEYDIKTQTTKDFPLENKFFNSQRAKVHAVMLDRDANLWLGIYQKGIMFIKNKNNFFHTIGHRTFDHNYIGSEAVSGFAQESNGRIWISTDNDGVYSLETDGSSKYHFSHLLNPSFPNIIQALQADGRNRIWVASYTDGLGYFTENGNFVRYPLYTSSTKKEVRSVMYVEMDNKGRLWAATLGSNLFCIDTNTDQLIPDLCEISDVDNWQSFLYFNSKNQLCVGGYSGAYIVDIDHGKPKVLEHLLDRTIVHSISEDREGKMWFATSEGLACYNPTTKQTQIITTKDGLPSNTVYAVKCENLPFIWVTTAGGIAEVSLDMNVKATFGVADGLQGNEFTRGAVFTDANGIIWFGGCNGATYFNPRETSFPEKKWEIRVTDFYLNNEPINIRTKSGLWNVVSTDVMEAKDFHLSHGDNNFTIEFGIAQFDAPDGLILEYTINGEDPQQLPKNSNRISFSGLPSGTYNIKVYVHGDPDSSCCEITVHVHTPLYNHFFAWMIYFCIFAFICYKGLQYVHKWLLTKKELQEHEHRNAINKSKLQMFTNISHDIRTPMTLILSPLERLMKDDSDPDKRKKSYGTMHRNASRILNLINQLMDVRKIESGKMEVSLCQQDIIPIIENVCESYAEKVAERNITFTYIHDCINQLYANIDIQHFDKIIANLLSNAMKFAPENGIVTVCVNKLSADRAEIAVNDNGIGIPDSEKKNIFERFYQVKNEDSTENEDNTTSRLQATGGTGIGLHLAKALVEMHNGTIRVDDSKDSTGCRFVIELPIIPEADVQKAPVVQSQEIVQEPAAVHFTEQPEVIETEDVVEVEPETSDTKEKVQVKRQQIQTNYRVLIVDDDPEIANYIFEELSDRYHCSICNNGKDALDQILKNPPHLVISDVLMPVMSGIELTKRVKANVNINHIPIVLVTALNDTQSNVEGLNVGAAAYLTKPFDITLLRTTVDNIIKSRQRLKNVYEGKQIVEKKIPKTDMQTPDERLMKRVMKIIEQHIFDHNLSVELLAQEVGISRVHLNRKLKELTNQTTTDFIKNIRLKRAANLLSKKKHSINEIADLVGFQSANSFSTAFRKLYGMSPREYMMKNMDE